MKNNHYGLYAYWTCLFHDFSFYRLNGCKVERIWRQKYDINHFW